MKIVNGVLKSINKTKDIKKGTFVIPNTVTSIGDSAFYNCWNLTSVTIPSSVTYIGYSAFERCSSLTNIEIPSSITFIGSSAFEDCTGLTSIEIPSSVTSIGYAAFRYCSKLTNIEIPSSVTFIGGYAFYYCSSLTSVTFGANSALTSIDGCAFWGCSSLTSITIPDKVTYISNSAFCGCPTNYYTNKKAIKCVKGFSLKNGLLTCRDFIYREGEIYKESKAELCNWGFHACLNGLDVFNYYSGENAVYYEVELSEISPERREDSKIYGKSIKLLRKLTVAEAANYRSEL